MFNNLKHAVRRTQNPVRIKLDISRSRYVAIATQPVHRLQIRQIVHN